MLTGTIEFIAIVLVIGCVYHAVRFESRTFAEQWFIGAYVYAVLREIGATAFLLTYAYSDQLFFVGAAPVFVLFLRGSLFYLALQFARRFVACEKTGWIAALMFLITASFALPLETTAVQLQWWTFKSTGRAILGGMRVFMLIAWGAGAAIFYFFFARVQRAPLPPRGKLYALITLAPIIAIIDLLVAFIVEI